MPINIDGITIDEDGTITGRIIDFKPVRHGHWTNFTSSTEECSCCGHEFYISALFSVGYNDEPPFCPNCGAKMDKTEERLVMPKADGSTIKIDKMDKVEDNEIHRR